MKTYDISNEETLFELAEFFKLFGDTSRIKILCALLEEELKVCDIAAACGISQSGASHQLRLLRQSRLVKGRKAGKETYYSLDDDHIEKILSTGMSHICEERGL